MPSNCVTSSPQQTPWGFFSWLCHPTYKNDTSTAKIVHSARRYGRNPSPATPDVRPQSSDSGAWGHGVRIFCTASHRGDILLRSRLAHRADTHHQVDSRRKVGKGRLSDGRWRPLAARHERLDKAETAVWLRLRSGPVNGTSGAGSGLGLSCLLFHFVIAKRAFNGIRMPKESIYADAR